MEKIEIEGRSTVKVPRENMETMLGVWEG